MMWCEQIDVTTAFDGIEGTGVKGLIYCRICYDVFIVKIDNNP